jgi:predicted metal-dependent phosphoesterase TrpH
MSADLAFASADLHVHTTGSDGIATPREVLDWAEAHTSLAVLAITDHDDPRPALRARELHARGRYRFDFVVGMEVTTLEGHLLALFIERRVPSFRPLAATLDAIHAQGGLAIIAHPMSPLTRSLGRHGIERIIARRADGLWFDGIELANSSPAGRIAARRAAALNHRRFRLAPTGSSDAHYLPAIGTSYTAFPGRTAEDLRAALQAGKTVAVAGRHPSLREIGVRNAARQSARALWATPSKVAERIAIRFGLAGDAREREAG